MISKLFAQLIKRKFTTGIALILIIGVGYFGYGKIFSNDGAIRYATAQVQNGTLIVSVSGSGQVSASNQVDVKPKASGEITAVYAKLGQEVGAGATLAAIDASDAERDLRDAETALETAKIDFDNDGQRAMRDAETALKTAKLELDKILEPVDELTLLQAENSLDQAKKSKQKAGDNIKKAYEDGFNSVSSAFLDLPGITAGLENLLFANTIDPRSGSGDNITWYVNQTSIEQRDKAIRYRDDVYAAYNKARIAYTANFDSYKSASRTSDEEVINALISETYNTSQFIADAIKTTDNYIDFVQDAMELRHLIIPSIVSTHQSNISSYTSKTNGIVVNLLLIQRSLKDSREAIVDADTIIKERELSLAKTKEGPDDLDIRAKKITIQQREDALLTAQQNIRSKKITIQQKEDALTTAKQTLADHYVRAPFAGLVAKVNVKKGDIASAGTAVATLVTKQKIAEVSLNEVDVAKVKVGQKVTLTFDAVPDLTITGQVAEIEAMGMVSQGVVTYIVKIAFDTQDERVKPAMSASAAIVTEAKPNVLLVPNSAVKSQGGMSYVEIPDEADMPIVTASVSGAVFSNPIRQQQIEVGLSNDEFIEITNGLQKGDMIVTRTIQPTSAQTMQTQQNSSLRIPGINTGGGGFRGGGGGTVSH